MAYKGALYYDEFDYDDEYQESLDYDTHDEHLPDLGDVLNCGFSVSKQISIQLLSLLVVNFVYRLIRQASEWLMHSLEAQWACLMMCNLLSDIPDFTKQLSSSLLGYFSTFIFFTTGNFFVCLLVFISFAFLKLLQVVGVKRQGFLVIAFQIVLLFTWWELVED